MDHRIALMVLTKGPQQGALMMIQTTMKVPVQRKAMQVSGNARARTKKSAATTFAMTTTQRTVRTVVTKTKTSAKLGMEAKDD